MNLSAESSSDPDGSITQIKWDFDYDELFNESGQERDAENDATPATLSLEQPGYYSFSVEVVDDDNSTARDDINIHVAGWTFVTLDSEDTIYSDADLALVAGRPAAVWRSDDGANFSFKFARSSTASGSASQDWSVVELASGTAADPDKGVAASIFDVGGQSALCWNGDNSEEIPSSLYFQRCNNDGTAPGDWPAPVAVYEGFSSTPQLFVVQQRPAIVFGEPVDNDVMYAHSSTGDGMDSADWDTRVRIDGEDSFVTQPRAGFAGGHPAVVYMRSGMGSWEAVFCRSTTISGDNEADWVGEDVPFYSGEFSPDGLSLGIADGRPAAVYSLAQTGGLSATLQYSLAGDTAGANWADPILLNAKTKFFFGGLLEPYEGHPMYVGRRDHDIVYTRASTAAGATTGEWPQPVVITGNDGESGSVQPPSGIIVNGSMLAVLYRTIVPENGVVYAVKTI